MNANGSVAATERVRMALRDRIRAGRTSATLRCVSERAHDERVVLVRRGARRLGSVCAAHKKSCLCSCRFSCMQTIGMFERFLMCARVHSFYLSVLKSPCRQPLYSVTTNPMYKNSILCASFIHSLVQFVSPIFCFSTVFFSAVLCVFFASPVSRNSGSVQIHWKCHRIAAPTLWRSFYPSTALVCVFESNGKSLLCSC